MTQNNAIKHKVVITGMGMVTPLGLDVNTSWQGIIAGKSGIKTIPSDLFDTEDIRCKIAGYIPRKEEGGELYFEPAEHFTPREISSMDRFIQLGLVAAEEAIKDSGWVAQDELSQQRTGVLVGSGIGGLICIDNHANILKEKGARRISPFFIPASLINLVGGHISIRHKFKGPNYAISTACATGAHCIGEAARLIREGEVDVMVCGGTEAAVCKLGLAGFDAARALSNGYNERPEAASRPWDKGRDGFVMGEGAGMLVLESLEHAQRRGARIYGEVAGYGLTADAYHITAPEAEGDGGYRAMLQAVKQAAISPEQIDYINAHGTSTPLGDMIELNAIRRLVGDHVQAEKFAISSTKSAIGHLLGAAGAVEAIFAIKALETGIVPPTLNLEAPEEACSGINFVPFEAQKLNPRVVLSNSFGFGGTNAALLLRKLD